MARGDCLRVFVPEIRAEISIHAMSARADEADGDAIVGRSFSAHAENGRGDNLRGNGRSKYSASSLSDKSAARMALSGFHFETVFFRRDLLTRY